MSILARLFNTFKSSNFASSSTGPELLGLVIQAGVNRKTIVVKLDPQDMLKKQVTCAKRLYVHDEEQLCKVGDQVTITACGPLSKLKHHFVKNVVKAGGSVKDAEAEIA